MDSYGRHTWEISVRRSDLLAATRKKVAFHKTRVRHWLAVRAKAEKAVKQKGIKIVPNIHFGNSTVGYNMPKREIAQLDDKLVEDVMRANGKVEEHRERVRSYDRYVQFITLSKQTYLALTIEDAQFFGIVTETDK